MLLCIDTATRFGGAALARDGVVLAQGAWQSPHNHTEALAPAVVRLLEEADATIHAVRGLAVVIGPGGFSALRVGLGFAKGVAEARGLPITPVSALDLEAAAQAGLEARRLCPLLVVGRDRVAWRLYERDGGAWQAAGEERVSTLAKMVSAAPAEAVYCGEGAWHTADALWELAPGDGRVIAAPPPTRPMAALAQLGAAALASGTIPDRGALEPRYLRPPSVTLSGRNAPNTTQEAHSG